MNRDKETEYEHDTMSFEYHMDYFHSHYPLEYALAIKNAYLKIINPERELPALLRE